jgi:hypothetical protein
MIQGPIGPTPIPQLAQMNGQGLAAPVRMTDNQCSDLLDILSGHGARGVSQYTGWYLRRLSTPLHGVDSSRNKIGSPLPFLLICYYYLSCDFAVALRRLVASLTNPTPSLYFTARSKIAFETPILPILNGVYYETLRKSAVRAELVEA